MLQNKKYFLANLNVSIFMKYIHFKIFYIFDKDVTIEPNPNPYWVEDTLHGPVLLSLLDQRQANQPASELVSWLST